MKIDFDQVMKTVTGEPITVPNDEDKPEETLLLKTVCVNAIFFIRPALPGEKPEEVKGEDKVKQYQLALKVQEGGEQDITAEEAAWLKKKVNDLYGILIAGQALMMLDG